MVQADVTLIVTVRERFSHTRESMESLLKSTDYPSCLVYVDVNSPAETASYLRWAAEQFGFTLVRVDRYIPPNQARNIGLRHVKTKYVVFLDNDVEFDPGWLSPLVRCAEEEDAWLVGPLYLHGPLEERIVHMAGGDMRFSGTWGLREFGQTQRGFTKPLDSLPPQQLVRSSCDIVEFHCALVRRDVFDIVGGMDEGLLTTREHLDLCQRVLAAGGSIYFEPASVVTYRMPPPFAKGDLPYFLLRWSDAWTRRTLEHFACKFGIAPNYVDRVKKTRRRRQDLMFGSFEPRIRRIAGRHGAVLARRLFRSLEPAVNQLLVRRISAGYRNPTTQMVVAQPADRTVSVRGS